MKCIKLSLLAITSVLLASCSGGGEHAATSVNTQSANNYDQAPNINCNIVNTSQPGQSEQIHTVDSLDTTFSSNPKQGDVLSVDCSGTTDQVGGVQFSVATNYNVNAPAFVPVSGSSFQLTMSTTGIVPYAIQATDADGLVRVKTFNLIVQCLIQVSPQLNLAGVTVTPTSELNYFNYSVNPSAVSGGSGFQYEWDFNGDGVYDSYNLTNSVWTSQNTVSNIYTIFATTTANPTRNIGLTIINNCGYESSFQIPVSFPMQNIARTPQALATPMPYFYLQADVSSSVQGQRDNGAVLLTWYPSDPIARVTCYYSYPGGGKPAGYTISAYNSYNETNQTDGGNPQVHGMSAQIGNIPDTGAVGLQSYTQADGVQVNSTNYLVAGVGDGFLADSFNLNSTCTVHISVQRNQGITPCAQGQTGPGNLPPVQIYGEFDCPSLIDSQGNTVAAHNGKYFCEVGPQNQCFGGGGGGGGNSPPHQ
jgi:hypothetical protein